jgi:hypothetical protein
MKRMLAMRMAVALAVGPIAGPLFAAEQADPPATPLRLTDGELDQVTAGDGSLLPLNVNLNLLLKDITVTLNVSNVPINAAVAIQANAIGQAIQNATVIAGQQVTQAQTMPGFH